MRAGSSVGPPHRPQPASRADRGGAGEAAIDAGSSSIRRVRYRLVGRGGSSLRTRRVSPAQLVAILAIATLLLPVPWMHVISEDPPGTAWRLDGRLEIRGEMVDPPGRWSWLAVGRPQLVGEVVRDQLLGSDRPAIDLREGYVTRRPALSEPAAVAVGLRHAGEDLPLGVLVELRDPLLEGYPQTGLLDAVNGAPLTDRQDWDRLSRDWRPTADDGDVDLTFRLRSGEQFRAPGPGLPYAEVIVRPLAPDDLRAGISFGAARLLPIESLRNLSLGSSHGLMVALVAYTDASGGDLAQGRHIAGTGGIRGDGSVARIGGLPAKAEAANRAGADVLLVPESQVHEIEELALEGTTVVPISSLQDAIDALSVPVA